ncbi:hypothetical protein R0135_03570 [Congregibacter variabilis]|uniref:Uncharacterized protein n=1 Tax=Congregibacter variabilis TaxID=3081200 RepID=A0ABZ0I406_9GAMM|nr:hypothetical protein R0135_03570 [Congregibacter sp. IMCC43200]
MLTESAYLGALIVYALSAMFAVALMNFWLLRSWSPGFKVLLSLPLLSLLLTPAFIQPEADTFAPAVVVVAFQWLSQGQEAATHALRPLLLFTSISAGLGVVLALILAWLGRRSSVQESEA